MKRIVVVAGAIAAIAAVLWFVRGGDDSARDALRETAPTPAAAPARARPAQPAAPPEIRFAVDDDREGTLRLEGQVIDPDQRPIGGATVRIDSNPPRETTTEEDGSFAFDRLVGRTYEIVARSDEGVAGPVTTRLTATTEPVILIVRPAASVEVRVVAADTRRPIDGATVQLRGLVADTAVTGAGGVARLDRVPAGGYQIAARAPGYAQATTWLRVGGAAGVEPVELALKPGAAVAGRVVDESGRPVQGAVVLYSGVSDWAQQAHPQFDGVVTGEDGAFRFAALPAGTFRFTARHPDFGPGASEPITLDGRSERTGVVVQLEPGAVLAGTVVDADGKPVEAAAVRVALGGRGMRFGPPRQTYSGDDGRFEMRGLPRREVRVIAVHETASSETVAVDLSERPERTDVTLSLDVTGRIAGHVVDADGEPVEGAQVMLWPDFRRGAGPAMRDFRMRGQAVALTDAGGAFEFRGLVDMPYQVRANPPGVTGRGRAFLREGVPAKVGDDSIVITLERDGAIKGRVAFDDGTPAQVFVVSLGGFRGGTPVTAKDGAFELTDVPPRTYQVSIRGPDFEQTTVADVDVAPGQTVDLGTITVRKGRSITGRVVTAQGAPVAGATVVLGKTLFGSGSSTSIGGRFGPPGAQRNKTTTTDDRGEFAIHGVPSYTLNIVAEHDEAGRTAPVTIPGSRESVHGLELVMQPTGALEGIVTIGGKPADGIRVSCQSQTVPGAIFGVATGADGRFRFDRLAPGSYMVSAMTGGNPMRGMGFHDGKSVTIASNQTTTVALEIGQGDVELVVNLRAKNGELRFAQVFAVQGEVRATTARELSIEIANRAGGFSSFGMSIGGRPTTIPDLSPGEYTVCAAPYPAEVQGMQPTIDYMEREGDNLAIYCAPVTVTPEPKQQSLDIEVEIPAFVPPDQGS